MGELSKQEGIDKTEITSVFESRKSRIALDPESPWVVAPWVVAPAGELAPYLEGPLTECGFQPVDAIDLRVLKPGSEIVFNGAHILADYLARTGEGGTITLWQIYRNSLPGTTTGLQSSRDAIFVYDAASVGKNFETDIYPGFLVKHDATPITSSIAMPYFSYDAQGNVMPPIDAWMDRLTGLWLRLPASSHHARPQEQ